MGRRVVDDLAERRRPAGAALVEDYDPPMLGIEEPAVNRGRSGSGTAVQEQRRRPSRVSGLLPIHHMAPIEPNGTSPIGLDRRKEVAAAVHRGASLSGPAPNT